MTGKTGTGRCGTYSYYICRGQREKRCEKKAVRRELLESRVVSAVLDALNDDSIVSWIADSVMELQRLEAERNQAAPAALKEELADVKKSIKGIITAIEAGVVTASTKERLLEVEQERLEAAIADASLPVPTVSREAVVYWLTRFRGQSETSEDAMRDVVDSLVWQVRVWEDHAEAVLNYSGTEEAINGPLLDAAGVGGGSPDGDEGWPEHHAGRKSLTFSTSAGGARSLENTACKVRSSISVGYLFSDTIKEQVVSQSC